jgi:hypothetical protein
MKKHALDLSLYPLELVPFGSINGPDNQYGQLHKPITANPYKEAGIKGFTPPTPFKATSPFLSTDLKSQLNWPSLSELNVNVFPFQWLSEEERKQYFDSKSISSITIMHIGPLSAAPIYDNPTFPSISTLTTAIIKSSDKLFLFQIQSAPTRLENGDLSESPSRNLCRCIHHASRMEGSWLNFTSVTPLTVSSMQLISAFGFNTIQIANFSHHSPQRKLISSVHLDFWLTTLIAISFQHSKNG